MSQPRPTAVELLDAVRGLLADDVLPQLSGRVKYHTRVAINVVDIVIRELGAGAAAAGSEAAEIAELLDLDVRTSLDELTRELARRVRSGRTAHDDPALVALLRRWAAADLAVVNPDYAD